MLPPSTSAESAAITFVVTTSSALIQSRGVPLAKHVYRGHQTSTIFVVEEASSSGQQRWLDNLSCVHAGSSDFGAVHRCEALQQIHVLIAKACSSARHDDVGIACKAERGLLFALHKHPLAAWHILCDDDAWWRLQPLHSLLLRFDASRKLAFGYYGCGNQAGMPRCVREQSVLASRKHAPHCFPVFALMSAPALRAIAWPLRRGYLQVAASSLNVKEKLSCTPTQAPQAYKCQSYMHDSALGFALWLAGVESGTDFAERSAPLNKCFNYSSLTPKRPCLLMHAHSRELGSIPGLTYAAALARLDEAGQAVDAAVRLSGGPRPSGCEGSWEAASQLRDKGEKLASPSGSGGGASAESTFLDACIGQSMYESNAPMKCARCAPLSESVDVAA